MIAAGVVSTPSAYSEVFLDLHDPSTGIVFLASGTTAVFTVAATSTSPDTLYYSWSVDGVARGGNHSNIVVETDWGYAGTQNLLVAIGDGESIITTNWTIVVSNDNDLDGMPNEWEAMYGLDPWFGGDGTNDLDVDGLSNLGEYQNHTSPTNADTDGDSLIDGWEVRHSQNPTDDSTTNHGLILQFTAQLSGQGVAQDVVCVSDTVYVAEGGAGIWIIDVSQSTNPATIQRITEVYPRQVRSVDVQDACLVAATWGNHTAARFESTIVFYDLANPTNPVLESDFTTNGLSWSCAVMSNTAYVGFLSYLGTADGSIPDSQVRKMDLANLSSPVHSGNLKGLDHAAQVRAHDGYIWIADWNRGLHVLDVNQGTNPVIAGSYLSSSATTGIARVHAVGFISNYVIAAHGMEGIHIIDASDMSNMTLHAQLALPGEARDVCVQGSLAFVAAGAAGCHIVDVSDPSAPKWRSTYDSAGYGYALAIRSNEVFLADGEGGLVILTLQGPSGDSDQDGMADVWEIAHFGTLTNGMSADHDADGLTAWGEYLAGTDPNLSDSDGDGLPDGEEVQQHFTLPSHIDSDGDRMEDNLELQSNTDPLDENDWLGFSQEQLTGGVTCVRWQSKASNVYQVVTSMDMETWTNAPNGVGDDYQARRTSTVNGILTYYVEVDPSSTGVFYMIELVP